MRRPVPRLLLFVVALLAGVGDRAAAAEKYEARPPVKVVLGKVIITPKVVFDDEQGLLLAPDGSLWIWGSSDAQFPETSRVPRRMGSTNLWLDVARTGQVMVAIRPDGTLWAWGQDRWLPGGDTNVKRGVMPRFRGTADQPISLSDSAGWTKVAGNSGSFYCAVKADGTLWTWGDNRHGQLGHGHGVIPFSPTPTQVGNETNWMSVAAGAFTGYALKSDGSLWGWGGFQHRGRITVTEPVQLGVVAEFSAGLFCHFGLTKDGTLMGFGSGLAAYYNLPDTGQSNLVACATGMQGVSIAAGGIFLLMRQPDGTVRVAGQHSSGVFGDGSDGQYLGLVTSIAEAVPVPGLKQCRHVWAGVETAAALTEDGTLWLWGQLGTREAGISARSKKLVGDTLRKQGIETDLGAIPLHTATVSTPIPLLKLEFQDSRK